MEHNPSGWKGYRTAVASGRAAHNGDLSRFQARYSMASRLVEVRLDGLGEKTAAGYTEALRVGLCYSALEMLETAVCSGVWTVSVESPSLAARFRATQCTRLRTLLLGHTRGMTLKAIESLVQDRNAIGMRPVAAGIRHLVFHGVLTPGGTGMGRSAHVRAFASDLSREVMAAADSHMTSWLIAQGIPHLP